MDFSAISIDGEGDLDESGIERVPMADPGLEVSDSIFVTLAFADTRYVATVPGNWN